MTPTTNARRLSGSSQPLTSFERTLQRCGVRQSLNPDMRENRATHGPQDQAARGQQGLSEAAKTVARQGNTVA
jgi:hypothetical protein